MTQKKLYCNRDYLVGSIYNIEYLKISCNNYGMKTNLQKIEDYLRRVKAVLDEQDFKKGKKVIYSMRTLDEFIE